HTDERAQDCAVCTATGPQIVVDVNSECSGQKESHFGADGRQRAGFQYKRANLRLHVRLDRGIVRKRSAKSGLALSAPRCEAVRVGLSHVVTGGRASNDFVIVAERLETLLLAEHGANGIEHSIKIPKADRDAQVRRGKPKDISKDSGDVADAVRKT